MNRAIADLRQNYLLTGLIESQADPNPFEQFKIWFEQALEAQFLEPNAMTLATVTPEGKPCARMVLLKDFDERGFIFFTNYNSAKGQQLNQTPWAALVFWWDVLERQVRIEGQVEKITPQESDGYFFSRPHDSRLGAWASEQSQVIESRDIIEQRLEDLKQKYSGEEVPRPSHWGGFRLIPNVMEFWQGQPSRLHDRLCYRRLADDCWHRERLSP